MKKSISFITAMILAITGYSQVTYSIRSASDGNPVCPVAQITYTLNVQKEVSLTAHINGL